MNLDVTPAYNPDDLSELVSIAADGLVEPESSAGVEGGEVE